MRSVRQNHITNTSSNNAMSKTLTITTSASTSEDEAAESADKNIDTDIHPSDSVEVHDDALLRECISRRSSKLQKNANGPE